jgi:glycosyltransferase involved in cell wall biosynthesis
MACEVPCVATAVGDAARLMGGTGTLVPPGDPEALAAAWQSVLALAEEDRRSFGARARARIVSEFQIERVVQRTSDIVRELAGNGAGRRPADWP